MLEGEKGLYGADRQEGKYGKGCFGGSSPAHQFDHQPADIDEDGQAHEAGANGGFNVLVMKIVIGKTVLFGIGNAHEHMRLFVFLVQQVLAVSGKDSKDPGVVFAHDLVGVSPLEKPDLGAVKNGIGIEGVLFYHADLAMFQIEIAFLDGIIGEHDPGGEQYAAHAYHGQGNKVFEREISLEYKV